MGIWNSIKQAYRIVPTTSVSPSIDVALSWKRRIPIIALRDYYDAIIADLAFNENARGRAMEDLSAKCPECGLVMNLQLLAQPSIMRQSRGTTIFTDDPDKHPVLRLSKGICPNPNCNSTKLLLIWGKET